MPLDEEVQKAINETARALKQPDKVAKRLVSWLNDMGDRELNLDEQFQHLENLKQAVDLNDD